MSFDIEKSEASQEREFEDLTPKEFQRLRGPISSFLSSTIQGGTQGQAQNLGAFLETVAPQLTGQLTGQERDVVDRIVAAGTTPGALESEAGQLIGRRLRGQELDPNNEVTQRFIRAAIRPLVETFNEEELERRALFTRAGQQIQESSPFSRAQAIATRGLQNAIGDVTSRILFGELQAGRERQTHAIDQAREQRAFEFARLAEALRASALPRLVKERGIERGAQAFNSILNFLANALQISGNLSQERSQVAGIESESTTIGGGFDLNEGLNEALSSAIKSQAGVIG